MSPRNTSQKSEVRSQKNGRPPRVGRFIKWPFTSFLTFALCILTWAAPFAAYAAPQDQPLLQSGDITYLGFFNVPEAAAPTFSYGGMGLAMGPDGNSLYYGGHVYEEALGRISIPALNGTASIITPPTAVPGSVGGENAQELAGALHWNGRLLVTKRRRYSTLTYQGVVAAGTTHITGFSAFQPTQGVEGHFISGYMGVIPPEWRSAFGGPCYIGNGAMSIRGMCTNGPSFYVFNPDDVGAVSPIPVATAQNYPIAHPLADPGTANDIWSASDPSGSYLFIDGTRTLLYINRHGYGPPTYKSDSCGDTAGGDGNSPYRRQMTAFDANDLLKAKAGQIAPYAVQPYAWWVLPGPTSTCGETGGYANGSYCFTWDASRRRIYGVLDRGENRKVHVWQVRDFGAPPPPPPPPSSTRCDINAGGSTDVVDVQLCANQAIGSIACTTGDIDLNGSCNVVDVQRVVNAALGGACVTP